MHDIVNICGVSINNLCIEEVLSEVARRISARIPSYIVTPNVDHLVKLQTCKAFQKAYKGAALVLADGMPLLWAAKFLCTPLKEKISGSDLFPRLCKLAVDQKYKLFFLGGRVGAAKRAADILQSTYPEILIVGTYCPSLGFENNEFEDKKIIQLIKNSKPDILFVGLGAPKQEKWLYGHYKELEVPISVGIGVTFEFISGMVKRAPLWMQKYGLEWFWRLIMEPKRLWKRYLIDDPVFFWILLRQKFSRNNLFKNIIN